MPFSNFLPVDKETVDQNKISAAIKKKLGWFYVGIFTCI
jgi:hypothetical protein